MTKIALSALTADGDPYAFGHVAVRLVDDGSGAATAAGLVVATTTVKLDENGEAEVDLTPNEDVDPPGTFYSLTVVGSAPTVVRHIEVPQPNGSGPSEVPYDWADETIKRLAPTPPRSIPAAGSGDVGQVLGIVDQGDGKEWRPVDQTGGATSLPDQTGHAGEYLTTDGTTASWATVSGGSTRQVAIFVDDIDAAGGAFTEVPLHGFGSVPREFLVGLSMLVVEGDDLGVWTVTASGPCTAGDALGFGEVIASQALQGLIANTSSSEGEVVDGVKVQATEGYVDTLNATTTTYVDTLNAAAIAETAAASSRAVATSQVIEDSTAYLKVGNNGGAHDDGAFECDTDLDFTIGLDIRVWGRLLRTNGDNSYCEWVTQTADGGLGSADCYEMAPWQDSDGILRWFAEHIMTGESVELDPKPITEPDNPDNPALGVLAGIRHTIDFTGGAGGNGVEKLWVPSADPDVVTADGTGWRCIVTINHDHPESIDTSVDEAWRIGMSNHESHIYVVQMFDGIDGTCLVDLHASDASSATSVTCRQGTVWTAAGAQGEIVNYSTGGGVTFGTTAGTAAEGNDARLSDARTPTAHNHAASDINSGTLDIARIPTGTTGSTVPFGNDARFSDTRTPTDASVTSAKLASSLSETLPKTVYPATTLSVTSSTTLVDATGMGIPVVSGKRYAVEGLLVATGVDTGDIKIGFTHPGGTMAISVTGHLISITSAGTNQAQMQAPLDTSGASQNWGLTATGNVALPVRGTFIASSTGTLQLQFAQRVSDSTATSLLTTSYLTYRVVP